jgi:hypothetical protein
MINIYNSPMLTRNFTLTNNIEIKIINKVNLPLLGIIQGNEQGGILIHMMISPIVKYPFILCRMKQQGLLSLKFRPHRATRTPHRQHRKTVIHGTRLIPQHSKRGQNYTKWPKNYKCAAHPLEHARARATSS